MTQFLAHPTREHYGNDPNAPEPRLALPGDIEEDTDWLDQALDVARRWNRPAAAEAIQGLMDELAGHRLEAL